jgi:predicted GNAT family acetyltransferase
MSETVAVVNNEAAHRFEATLEGETAFAEYRLRNGVMILPHTVVPEAFAGRGIGGQLAEAALTYAREEGLEVVPTCPFMSAYVVRHPEWHDLVQPACREKLGIEG